MARDRRETTLVRVLDGVNRALLVGLGRAPSSKALADPFAATQDGLSPQETKVVLEALTLVLAALIGSTDSPFDAYRWFVMQLADRTREVDIEVNSSDGRMLH